MASEDLNTPVTIQATRIDATLLPKVFSQPYMLYVVQQGTDLGSVADKANSAGQGAYDAQVKNDEQDKTLANHESRIEAAESKIIDHEIRIKAAESTLVNHESRISSAEAAIINHESRIVTLEGDAEYLLGEVADHESRIKKNTSDISTLSDSQEEDSKKISDLQDDYLSKSQKTAQSMSGALGVTTSLSVNGVKVVGAQQTGWTAATGTANKSAFNADQAYTVGATYSQTEVQAIIAALVETRQRVKAIEDMARNHGLIL